jgi:AraC-like DNA-binding protein
MLAEAQRIVRLSTSDVAPAERLNLILARVDVASRMLQSPLDRVTTAEIGRRAGFSDASHFTKVVRMRTGQTPLQIRRARHS